MRKLVGSRRVQLVVAGAAAFGIATAAYAYWTAGGSGSGSASAAGTQAPLTAHQTSSLSAMYPGDTAQTLAGDFSNTNSGPIHVATVTVSIASVDKAVGVQGTCDASDFTLANAVMPVGAEVPAGEHVGSFSGATIRFNDKASNQDACKDATVNLAYAIS